MSKILELRTKRNTLWEQTKDFLEKNRGENGLVKAEAVEQYNKMAQEVKDLGAEIERYREADLPAIILIPGVSGNTGQGIMAVKKSVEQAVGSDIIFNN